MSGGVTFAATDASLLTSGTLAQPVANAGVITSSSASAGIGYATGAGNAVTQLTSKTTAVTINAMCGKITMNGAAFAAGNVTFTVNNSSVAAADVIILNLTGGSAAANNYRYWIAVVASGSFQVTVENRSGGSLSEALTFNFAVIKAVTA